MDHSVTVAYQVSQPSRLLRRAKRGRELVRLRLYGNSRVPLFCKQSLRLSRPTDRIQ